MPVPAGPVFTPINLTDTQSYLSAAFFTQLQANIASYGQQFLPLVGGTLAGTVIWSLQQTFPSKGVTIGNPNYPHTGVWQTLQDHIDDASIHRLPSAPQIHAGSHIIGGTDPLYGDVLSISATQPAVSIRNYIDTQVAAGSAAATTNYAPASYYQIAGTSPLYGSSIAVAAASATTSIKSYVDTQISALSGSYPAAPTFTNVTLSTAIFSSTVSIASSAAVLLKSNGTNLQLSSETANGVITFGNPGNPTAFGTISSTGISLGSTVLGPTSGSVNGPFTANGDLQANRSSTGAPAAGGCTFGSSAGGAALTYNADVANSFYLTKPLSINGNLSLLGGSIFSLGSTFTVGTLGASLNQTNFTITNGTGLVILGTDPNGSLELRSTLVSGQPFVDFTQGSTAPNAPNYTQRIALSADGTRLSTTGTWGATSVIINGGTSFAAGDLGLARSTTAGQINFGSSETLCGQLDYGVTAAGIFTVSLPAGIIGQILADGTYRPNGTSTYGPTAALVNGTITANKAIYAQTGITFTGTSGYTFTGNTTGDTGLFSNAPGDLRLYTAGSPALTFQNSGNLAIFAGAVTVGTTLTSTSLAVSGAITAGSLILNGALQAGNTSITKFRVKSAMSLGYVAGVASTSNVYPNTVTINYTGGQIEAIRLSAVSADGTGTATTFQIKKNGVVIATIALPTGGQTAIAYPIVNPTPLVVGDQLQAFCTVAGTATGVSVIAELSQYVY